MQLTARRKCGLYLNTEFDNHIIFPLRYPIALGVRGGGEVCSILVSCCLLWEQVEPVIMGGEAPCTDRFQYFGLCYNVETYLCAVLLLAVHGMLRVRTQTQIEVG